MRIYNLQLLRFVATAAVVLAHLGMYAERMFDAPGLRTLLHGNWVCFLVPVFFALSGFLLTQVIQNSAPGPFLFARALRLYPGFWIATGLFSVVIALTGWPDTTPIRMRLANVGWTLRPGEYGSRLFILGVEWSLVYELMLYVGLTGLSLLGTRRGLPLGAAVWLVAIGVKVLVWPGYAMNSPRARSPLGRLSSSRQ